MKSVIPCVKNLIYPNFSKMSKDGHLVNDAQW